MSALETMASRSGAARLGRAWMGSLAIVVFSYSGPLRADSGPLRADNNPRDQARQLAAQGFDALQRKDYGAAEDLFRRADELVHAPTLLVDRARALIGLGKLVEGHEAFAQVLREGVAPDAPWQWKKAVDAAAIELHAVERRLAWLTITVKGPQAASVDIDGRPVPPAALGVRRATNPGARTVMVQADRFLPLQQIVTLREGEAQSLELELKPDPAAPPLEPYSAPEVAVVVPTAPQKATDHTLATALFVASAVGVAAGTVTGVLALGERSSLKKACGGRVCVPNDDAEYSDERQKIDRYRGLGTASGVAFAFGVGAALGGLAVLHFTSERSSGNASALGAQRASLVLGPGSLQFSCHF